MLCEKLNVDVNTIITFVNYFVDLANRVVQLDHYLQMVESKVNYLFHLVSVSSGFNTADMTNSWTSPHTQLSTVSSGFNTTNMTNSWTSPHTQLSNRSLLSNDNRPPGSYSGAISNGSTTDTPSSSCSGATGSLKEPLLNNKASTFLKRLAVQKEEKPLPPINKSILQQPETVVEKYPKLLNTMKIPTLSVRLAKESFFGKEIMKLCTVRGTGILHPLPVAELSQLKKFLMDICLPRFTPTKLEFENLWKSCIESIGQACKSLRNAVTIT